MKEIKNLSEIPTASTVKKVEFALTKIELKNVKTPDGEEDMTVEVIPFDRRKETHETFAFAYMDMVQRMPSRYMDANEAARAYVEMFVKHDEKDLTNENSTFMCVCKDLRACRTLLYQNDFQKAIADFFVNA